jgi:inward rectifier potassium channel
VIPHHTIDRRLTLGGRPIITQGLPRRIWQDLYHLFMTASWPALFGTFAGFFVVLNLSFAALYSLQPAGVANLNPPGYWGRFFFSVETLATVGYGDMHPQLLFTHIVAAVEIFVGMMSVGLTAGMMFARFSRPFARFMFANHIVIRPVDGVQTLMLRAANARQNVILEAQAQLRLIRQEVTIEGFPIRRIYDLPLRRSQHPIFIFGWTLLHVIDAASPMYAQTEQSLIQSQASLLLTISGTDQTTGQTLMARRQYPVSSLRWDHSFVDILSVGADGVDRFDYTKFHEIQPLSSAITRVFP